MEFAWFAETKKMWSSQRRKEWRERICTQFIYITELRRRLADLREREKEREKRGEKELLLLVIDFAGTIFSPTRTTDHIMYADNPMQQR
jgi:hypothetical protein